MIAGYEVHEAAELFPLITGELFRALLEDIRANGQMEPIVLDGAGRIIDGRNRARACEVLCIAPVTKVYDGADVVQFVVSHNLHRRQLTDSQRAMIAAELANLPWGANQFKESSSDDSTSHVTRAEAATSMKVSSGSLDRALRIRKKGTPGLVALAKETNAGLATLARVVELPAAEQDVFVEQVKNGVSPRKAAPIKKPKPATNLAMPQPPKMGGNRRKHLQVIDAALDSLTGLAIALDEISLLDESVTAEEATRLTGGLSRQIRSLNRINQLIKERTT